LLELGAELESRDLDKERLTEAELDELIGSAITKISEHAQRALSHAENEGASAVAFRGHQTNGQGTESHSQAGGASRIQNGARI